MTEVRLTTGACIHLRYFMRDSVGGLYPTIVIRHDDDGLLTWTPPGSRHWFPFMPDGRELRATALPEWVATDKPWRPLVLPRATLSWRPTGRPFALQAYFEEDGRLSHFYANIEAPAVAWRDESGEGADSQDWDLDVWIEPDLDWRLKDEDDVAQRSQWPDLYWVDPVQAYAAAHEAIELVQERRFPFDGGWPDLLDEVRRTIPAGPQWTPIESPSLPAGWDRPRHG